MVKRGSYFIILLFGITASIFSQDIDFSSASNTTRVIKYNEKLKNILDTKDINTISNFLNKYPGVINDATEIVTYQGKYTENAKKMKPAIHDLLDRCINNDYPIEIFDLFVLKGVDLNTQYDGLSVYYRILNHIATHNIEESQNALKLFYYFSEKNDFDINKEYRDNLPPLAYLLRTNFDFLGKKYDKNYVSSDIIKTFIEKGTTANTYDQEGNNLLAYAVQTNNVLIQQYLTSNDVDEDRINKKGQDVMYGAIVSGSLESIQEMVKRGYKLVPTKLVDMKLHSSINKNDKLLCDYLSDISYTYINDYDQLRSYILLFDEKKRKLLENNFYLQQGVKRSNIIDFIKLMEQNNPSFDEHEKSIIQKEKIKYINGCSTIGDLVEATKAFPLFRLSRYQPNYFKSEENLAALSDELYSVNSTYLNEATRDVILYEIRNKSFDYYNSTLRSLNSVKDGIDLANNFPSKKSAIELVCHERFCDTRDFSNIEHGLRWSEEIKSQRDYLDNYAQNCKDFLSYFSYNSIISDNLSVAEKKWNNLRTLLSDAYSYERELTKAVESIYGQIKATHILPDFDIEDKGIRLGNQEYEIKITEQCAFRGQRETIIQKSDRKYYVYSVILWDDGPFNTINEAVKYICLNFWNANIWTSDPDAEKFQHMERIIREFKKYGIQYWYKMSLSSYF